MEDGRKIRGSLIEGYFKFIKRTWGERGLSEVTAATGIDPESIKGRVWYDHARSRAIMEWIRDIKGPQYIERCGHYTVKDLGLLSYIVAFMDVKSLLKRAPKSYHDGFSFGEVDIDLSDSSATITMKDCATYDGSCNAWVGALKGILEVTNTRGTVEETQCQLKGSPCCIILVKWEQ